MSGFFKTREFREFNEVVERLKTVNTRRNRDLYFEKRNQCIQICGAEFGNIGFDKESGRYRWDMSESCFGKPVIKVKSEVLRDFIYIFEDGTGMMIREQSGKWILYNESEVDRIIEMCEKKDIDRKKLLTVLHDLKTIFEGDLLCKSQNPKLLNQ